MMGLSTRHAPSLDLPARFMAFSIAALGISVLISPWTLPKLQEHFSEFSLLAFVHLNTLGFIGAMIFGASYQLVPVVLQTPLRSVRTGRMSFWFYSAGLIVFLAGLMLTWLPGLAIGGTLLGVAFLLYAGVILGTVQQAPRRDIIGWHMIMAVIGSCGGMSIGVMMAFNKSNGMLGDRLLDVLAAHIVVMLAGWVGIMLTGVAYRLICMFTLAEKYFQEKLAWAELVSLTTGTWLFAARFIFRLPAWTGQVAALLLLAGFACFAIQIIRLYRNRMRRTFDIHIPFALAAAMFAIAANALLVTGLFRHESPVSPVWVAVTWLAIFGVAGTAIQGFFYKISTFLVWLKRYAPIAGKQKVPKLEELYIRRLALTGWFCWMLAIIGGTTAILLEWSILSGIGVLMIAGAVPFLVNVMLIARHWRTGPGLSLREPVVTRPPAPSRVTVRA